MADDRQHDQDRPNRASNREPAEGSRDTARQSDTSGKPDSGAGITNRGPDRERAEQDRLPPRGQSRDED